jgi:uncharacterized membrane protein (UPF0127 family)
MRGVFLGMAVAAACASRGGGPAPNVEPTVVLRPSGGKEVRVRVELARTDAERARGLMFRDRLDEGSGMLFLFEREDQQRFWMKNTYIPLDMIFITKDHRVLGMVENAEPLTETGRMVPGRSQFVLEVQGGFAARHRVGPGTEVEFLHVQ